MILKHHPDKCTAQPNNDDDIKRFHEIDEAWKVLRDADKRKQYDAEMGQDKFNEAPIVHDMIKRDEFEWNAESEVFAYPCRCGGLYMLPDEYVTDSVSGQHDEIYIECDECSLVIQLLGNSM